MIIGRFDELGRPFIECLLTIPRLRIETKMYFLVDTGTSSTCLNPRDAKELSVPFDQLGNISELYGVGGAAAYFRELAFLELNDGGRTRFYGVRLLIARSTESNPVLPSLLGRDVVNQWYMHYDPTNGRLEFEVQSADYTLDDA